MINTQFHKLPVEQRKKFLEEKKYLHDFPNRSQRRSNLSNRNLVRQDIIIRDKNGKEVGTNTVYHRKKSNIPYQYNGIVPVKGSIAAARKLASN